MIKSVIWTKVNLRGGFNLLDIIKIFAECIGHADDVGIDVNLFVGSNVPVIDNYYFDSCMDSLCSIKDDSRFRLLYDKLSGREDVITTDKFVLFRYTDSVTDSIRLINMDDMFSIEYETYTRKFRYMLNLAL